jgi:hypothetical protein
MAEEDDRAPERPASPNVPRATPSRPGAPPSARAKPPPPPPAKAAAKKPPPPPDPESNPFLAPSSSREIDAGWLSLDDVSEEAAPVAPEPAPPPEPPEPAPPPENIAPLPHASPASVAQVESTDPVKPETGAAPDSTSEPSPFRKPSRAKVIAFVVFPMVVLLGGAMAYQATKSTRPVKVERTMSSDDTARVEPPVPSAEPAPPPTFTVDPPPSAAKKAAPSASGALHGGAPAALSADPSKTGILDTTPLPAGRKIIVDGRFVGMSPRRIVARCGVHRIQIGDLPPETLELPCGGEISFTD